MVDQTILSAKGNAKNALQRQPDHRSTQPVLPAHDSACENETLGYWRLGL